jgi:hypothetical protein
MAKVKKSATKSTDQLVTKLKKQLKETNSLWESKYKVIKGQLKAVAEESYIHGYRDAIMDQTKLDEAFDKHMEVAANQFEKMHFKKLSGKPQSKSNSKTKAKAKPKAKVKKPARKAKS